MTTLDLSENPFKVFTPEDMDASDVAELFVNPPDAAKIEGPGHTMLSGARGCGKSMIFRYLLPDCQQIALKKQIEDLPFLAFLVSIKNAGPTPTLTEFLRLENKHANIVMNEHVLTAFVATKVFSALSRIELPSDRSASREASDYYAEFGKRMRMTGSKVDDPGGVLEPRNLFGRIAAICDEHYSQIVQFVKRFAASRPQGYTGALWDYLDFLFPLLAGLKSLSFLPDAPIYLLIDDGDYLNRAQTMALNSWISTRTQAEVSIKVSTQLGYKTFQTVSGLPIQSPHDFQTINISDLYTTGRGRYHAKVCEIVVKRLRKAGINGTPQEFFPCDQEQERAIEEIEKVIREKWEEGRGRGYRVSDDVLRYSRPEYMRSLGGKSKSMSTYSYSGFDQLVHISSGLVRYFLESAARMFDEERSRRLGKTLAFIEPAVQDKIARASADEFMTSEFGQLEDSTVNPEDGGYLNEVHRRTAQLRNLVRALGGTFYLKLISDDAERRVFSVAISGAPDPNVVNVLDLGVRYGYFHRSTIGNKEGTGRTQLYILTRRLAPYFKLDPSSFAGYLWVTNDAMRKAMANPESVLRRMQSEGVSKYFEVSQLELFEGVGEGGSDVGAVG